MDKRERARRDYGHKREEREKERKRETRHRRETWKKKEKLHTYIYTFIFSLPLFVLSRSLSIDCELVSNPKASSVPSARSFLGDAADKETSSTLYQVGGNGRREVTRSGTPVRCSPPSSSSIHLVLPFPHSRPPPPLTLPLPRPLLPLRPVRSPFSTSSSSFVPPWRCILSVSRFPAPPWAAVRTTRPPTWREIRHVVLMASLHSPNKGLPERVQRALIPPLAYVRVYVSHAYPRPPFCVRLPETRR